MKPNKPVLPKHELRVLKNVQRLEIRKTASGARTISGYFATFNTLSDDLGGFFERIKPGAFTDSLKSNPEVLALYNHNTDLILGRVSSGTLTVSEDSIGLRFNVTLPDTSYANDLVTLMERGDVAACSFAFNLNGNDGDTWEIIGDKLVRTLVSVRLYEGSIVGSPAYPNTVADLRSCPVTLRSKLNRRDGSEDDDPEDHPGQHWDDEQGSWVDDDDDSDDLRSLSRRCQYRCLTHRSENAGRDQSAGFADDDNQVRCAMRCGACSECQTAHSNLQEDSLKEDDVRAEHRRLLALR